MTHEATTIPLNKLTVWDGNVRKTGVTDGIDELAASIAAHGLLQSLVVRKAKRGKYAVVAGQRRLLALQALAKSKAIAGDLDIPCTIAEDDVDGAELSLAENVMRVPMHPADQFEAFRTVIDSGAGIADVAARFGVTDSLVAKRLKLGRLSPVILDAYREDKIGLEEAQAFAISDDHEAQERVFAEMTAWNRQPHSIRRALTAEEIPASDKRVKFVGFETYEAAGGAIRRDLFGHDDDGYVQDAILLDSLVAEKLSAIAGEITGEGWRWVEIVPDLDYEALSQFSRLYPERIALSDEDQAELDKLTAEYDELVDTDEDGEIERLDAIDQRIDELSSEMERWTSDTLATAGAIVTLSHSGAVRIERGLVRPADIRKAKNGASDTGDATVPAVTLSAKLVEDLTAQKTAAIAAVLSDRPDMALAAVVHALALNSFYPGYRSGSCLDLHLTTTPLRKSIAQPDEAKGLAVLEQAAETWREALPGNPADLWTWCLEQSRDELLRLLAYLASCTVNAVHGKADRPDRGRLVHAGVLAQALQLDMTDWFTPSAGNFFNRVSRAAILASVEEARGGYGPALDRMKKAELATRAADMVAGTGWLPAPLRITETDDNAADASAVHAEAAE